MSATVVPATLTDIHLQHEITQFLYHEATLLDTRQFEQWVELFSEDAHYYMPTRAVRYEKELALEFSRNDEVAHFDETKHNLAQRVARLRTGMAWAEDPPSRLRHYVTNVQVIPTEVPEEYLVRVAFLVFRGHLDREAEYFSGARIDLLRRAQEAERGWLIARRRIELDQTLILSKNISFFF